jgi:CIC family chloride channel protein
MGAVLAAVVHAPMASILIVFELTQDYKVMLPAMLACITATGMARLLYRDSIYTATLRRRGLRVGAGSDLQGLRQTSIEQMTLEPATVVQANDPLQRVLELMSQMGTSNFVVIDREGHYLGMLVSEDINAALMEREAIPLMIVSELMRIDLPRLNSTDDLAAAMNAFARYDVSQLPVVLAAAPDKVIGMISRAGLLRRYQLTLG